MADERLSKMSNFTATKHTNAIPEKLDPARQGLSSNLAICVIGAGKGIGEHIAYAYARASISKIVLAARTTADLDRVAQNIKQINPQIDVRCHPCDVANAVSVSNLADFVKTAFGRLDILISNPGYAGPVTLQVHKGQPEWVQRAFDVNAMGTYHVAHYFIPLLLGSENGAKTFLVIGSLASIIRRGVIANTGYCIRKLAQARFVEMFNEQYKDQGLVTITIHPGAVATDMAVGNTPEPFLPYLIDDIGLCGAICVWLSAHIEDLRWLSGRFISANWDMEEMVAQKGDIVRKDLLKLAMVVA